MAPTKKRPSIEDASKKVKLSRLALGMNVATVGKASAHCLVKAEKPDTCKKSPIEEGFMTFVMLCVKAREMRKILRLDHKP